MPSHTFTRYATGKIHHSNRAAACSFSSVSQTAEELHRSDYQVYAYLQRRAGRSRAPGARGAAEIASRSIRKCVVSARAGPDAGYFALAAIPARYL